MNYKVTIPGKLPGMNEWIAAQNRNRYVGAKMKKEAQDICSMHIVGDLHNLKIREPVSIEYVFYEQNKRRDHDNVSGFAHKVIQDALVTCGVLADDGWDDITGYTDTFKLDRKNPRIEIQIITGGS